jgi:hypothetical protein
VEPQPVADVLVGGKFLGRQYGERHGASSNRAIWDGAPLRDQLPPPPDRKTITTVPWNGQESGRMCGIIGVRLQVLNDKEPRRGPRLKLVKLVKLVNVPKRRIGAHGGE